MEDLKRDLYIRIVRKFFKCLKILILKREIILTKQTFTYFQPEYVNKFKCDGQACKAHCCKYWNIDIDKKTYKKYNSIKPKSKAAEIINKIKKDDKKDRLLIKLNEKRFCPFLTEDNWCSIQRTYGADFLSNTCSIYPRITRKIDDFYERSLTLTCPIVANLILKNNEPMIFEQTEITSKEYIKTCRDMVILSDMPKNLLKYLVNIQYAVISILQERRLKLDQRLIVIGFFFEQLEELINYDKLKDIETLALIYTSEDFFNEQVPSLIKSIEFNASDYMKIMFDVFVILYGEKASIKAEAQKYLNYMVNMLEIKLAEDGTASVSELVESYNKHIDERDKFLEKFSHIFENYLVQEFFSGLYPWRVNGSITLNYSVFLITYKILELMAVSMSVVKNSIDEDEIIKMIRWYAEKIDHGINYIKPIAEGMKEKYNNLKIMRAFLQN